MLKALPTHIHAYTIHTPDHPTHTNHLAMSPFNGNSLMAEEASFTGTTDIVGELELAQLSQTNGRHLRRPISRIISWANQD